MSNLQVKFYHRNTCIGRNIEYTGFGFYLQFQAPTGGHGKWGTTAYTVEAHNFVMELFSQL